MSKTVVGVFDNYAEAQQVQQELASAGYDRDHIRVMSQGRTAEHEEKGFWASLKDLLGFGDGEDDEYGYREASRRGGTIVSVVTDDNQVDSVIAVMRRHNVIDLDQRMQTWRSEGWTGRAASGATATSRTTATTGQAAANLTGHAAGAAGQTRTVEGQEAIPVVEEQLQVGKQQVQGGGVRIHSRIVEKPVEAQVNLREEHVHVERRPVDRPLTGADLTNAFQERTIEAVETDERAVVGKQARVVEEVVVNKDVDQRTETVRDTVRRTEVDVEKIPAEFASQLSTDERFRGRAWDEVETDAQSSFEQRYPGQWNQYRDSIRNNYERGRTDRTRSST